MQSSEWWRPYSGLCCCVGVSWLSADEQSRMMRRQLGHHGRKDRGRCKRVRCDSGARAFAQDAKAGDRGALAGQCEPLLAVAEAHAEGKEAFARSIATELFSDYLSVEERFAANKEATEQEVIDSLRQVLSHDCKRY